MPYLYGGNVLKAHVHRWSEDLPEHAGVLVFDDSDNCLGFGVTARSSAEAKKLEPTGIVVFRQGNHHIFEAGSKFANIFLSSQPTWENISVR